MNQGNGQAVLSTPSEGLTRDLATPNLPVKPGKVIAVHLSYASRAKQRGLSPASPSYFFKPISSLAGSGSAVERPKGCELLAFEGEIALMIGRGGSHIPLDQAWCHVGWVTAANDFGLYDFREADKGSNVRAKGRDGYCPIGPTWLEASQVDPTDLRLRTWVDGALAQDDDTSGLLFPLAQVVADLSQHFELQPGDIILTGTPAGSTTVNPGSVVEVAVESGSNSTGRLVSHITQSEVPFDPALGSMPQVSATQRQAAQGKPSQVTDQALRDMLSGVGVATLTAQLRSQGLSNVVIEHVRPLRRGVKLVGRAVTLRFVAHREDLFQRHGGGYNAQKRAFDQVEPGQVVVIEARGDTSAGTLGDVLALRAMTRGAAGVVTDGAVRDSATVAGMDMAVFAGGRHPAVLGKAHVPMATGAVITCGGAAIEPGDWIVGDDDGAIVLPAAMAEQVAQAAAAQEAEDEWIAQRVAEGESVKGLFPMDDAWKARFKSWSPK